MMHPPEGMGAGTVSALLADLRKKLKEKGKEEEEEEVGQQPSSPEKRQKRKTKRRQVLGEIVSTEQSYVEQLQAVEHVYLKPLLAVTKTENEVLPLKVLDVIFHNIRSIQDLNTGLLKDLQQRVDKDPDACEIGPVFVDFVPFFKLYEDYIRNHVAANKACTAVLAPDGNVKFQKFHEKASADPQCKGLGLIALLITPIQRVPRYKLLLDELIKNTEQEHTDKPHLQKALTLIEQAADNINEAVRELEQQEYLKELQDKTFGGAIKLVKKNRYHIKQGQLTKVCRAADKPFTFFLFNDILLYGTKQFSTGAARYKIHQQIELNQHMRLDTEPANAPSPFAFTILSNIKSFVVYGESQAEKDEWLKAFEQARADFRAKSGPMAFPNGDGPSEVKAVWVSDKESKECLICKVRFTLVNRRHHCRKCGVLCCQACSKARMVLPGDASGKRVRLCVNCEQQLLAEGNATISYADDESDSGLEAVQTPVQNNTHSNSNLAVGEGGRMQYPLAESSAALANTAGTVGGGRVPIPSAPTGKTDRAQRAHSRESRFFLKKQATPSPTALCDSSPTRSLSVLSSSTSSNLSSSTASLTSSASSLSSSSSCSTLSTSGQQELPLSPSTSLPHSATFAPSAVSPSPVPPRVGPDGHNGNSGVPAGQNGNEACQLPPARKVPPTLPPRLTRRVSAPTIQTAASAHQWQWNPAGTAALCGNCGKGNNNPALVHPCPHGGQGGETGVRSTTQNTQHDNAGNTEMVRRITPPRPTSVTSRGDGSPSHTFSSDPVGPPSLLIAHNTQPAPSHPRPILTKSLSAASSTSPTKLNNPSSAPPSARGPASPPQRRDSSNGRLPPKRALSSTMLRALSHENSDNSGSNQPQSDINPQTQTSQERRRPPPRVLSENSVSPPPRTLSENSATSTGTGAGLAIVPPRRPPPPRSRNGSIPTEPFSASAGTEIAAEAAASGGLDKEFAPGFLRLNPTAAILPLQTRGEASSGVSTPASVTPGPNSPVGGTGLASFLPPAPLDTTTPRNVAVAVVQSARAPPPRRGSIKHAHLSQRHSAGSLADILDRENINRMPGDAPYHKGEPGMAAARTDLRKEV
eukprot:g1533.t1